MALLTNEVKGRANPDYWTTGGVGRVHDHSDRDKSVWGMRMGRLIDFGREIRFWSTRLRVYRRKRELSEHDEWDKLTHAGAAYHNPFGTPLQQRRAAVRNESTVE